MTTTESSATPSRDYSESGSTHADSGPLEVARPRTARYISLCQTPLENELDSKLLSNLVSLRPLRPPALTLNETVNEVITLGNQYLYWICITLRGILCISRFVKSS